MPEYSTHCELCTEDAMPGDILCVSCAIDMPKVDATLRRFDGSPSDAIAREKWRFAEG